MKTLFVTVGTTRFDLLISQFNSPEFLTCLAEEGGIQRLVIQHGHSPAPSPPSSHPPMMQIELFSFRPSLQPHLQEADLVVSHAGAGSIMETLALGKPLVVVVNAALHDNHQLELSGQLHADRHLVATKPEELHGCLARFFSSPPALLPIPPPQTMNFPKIIDDLMFSI